MNCRTAEDQIYVERDDALDAAGRRALDEHVQACAACRQKRETLTFAIGAWRTKTAAARVPEAQREWESIRRQIRGGASTPANQALPRRRFGLSWLALPLGAAAAIMMAFYANWGPASVSSIGRNDAVEVSAADGSVVFVDDKSGWVVIWEGEPGPRQI